MQRTASCPLLAVFGTAQRLVRCRFHIAWRATVSSDGMTSPSFEPSSSPPESSIFGTEALRLINVDHLDIGNVTAAGTTEVARVFRHLAGWPTQLADATARPTSNGTKAVVYWYYLKRSEERRMPCENPGETRGGSRRRPISGSFRVAVPVAATRPCPTGLEEQMMALRGRHATRRPTL